MKEQASKPHIKKNKHGWWKCSGPSVVGLLPAILTANGFTKEEAYETWYGKHLKAKWSGMVLCSLREEFLK